MPGSSNDSDRLKAYFIKSQASCDVEVSRHGILWMTPIVSSLVRSATHDIPIIGDYDYVHTWTPLYLSLVRGAAATFRPAYFAVTADQAPLIIDCGNFNGGFSFTDHSTRLIFVLRIFTTNGITSDDRVKDILTELSTDYIKQRQ